MTVVSALFCVVLSVVLIHVEGKKKESFPVIKELIPYISCQVCQAAVAQCHGAVDAMRKNVSRHRITESDILEEVVEQVCNPFSKEGEWIRTADVVPSEEGDGFEIEYTEFFGKCKRECHTIGEACLKILDSEAADALSSWLFKGKKSEGQIRDNLCKAACKKKGRSAAAGKTKLNFAWAAETLEEIDNKEKEIESMIDSMQRSKEPGSPGMDVYSRDEMTDIQDALRDGDYKRFVELDPQGSEMSEEEFHTLRKMKMRQDAGEDLSTISDDDPDLKGMESRRSHDLKGMESRRSQKQEEGIVSRVWGSIRNFVGLG